MSTESNQRNLLLKLYKKYYELGNSLLMKDPFGSHLLSLPNEVNRTGILFVDTGTWFALNQQVPNKKHLKWVIDEEYIYFYSTIKSDLSSP